MHANTELVWQCDPTLNRDWATFLGPSQKQDKAHCSDTHESALANDLGCSASYEIAAVMAPIN